MLKCFKYSAIFLIVLFLGSFLFNIEHNISPFVEQHFYWFTFVLTFLFIIYTSCCFYCGSILYNRFVILENYDSFDKDKKRSVIKENNSYIIKNILKLSFIIIIFILTLPTSYYYSEIFYSIMNENSYLSYFSFILLILFYIMMTFALIGVLLIAFFWLGTKVEFGIFDEKKQKESV